MVVWGSLEVLSVEYKKYSVSSYLLSILALLGFGTVTIPLLLLKGASSKETSGILITRFSYLSDNPLKAAVIAYE